MKALFVNGSSEEACGVNQLGKNLYAILKDSKNIQWEYCAPDNIGQLRAAAILPKPDAVLYNYQQGQNTFLNDSPFPWLGKQYCCYHDLSINEDRFDGILFSDPTMTPQGKWHVIGRPLPRYHRRPNTASSSPIPVIGSHGFLGAWSDQLVHKVTQEFEHAIIRLNLPFAKYGDANGSQATAMAERCRNMLVNKPGISLQISHDFLPMDRLLDWLRENDINCYLRPPAPWRGVSSAPDAAISVGKPVCVNKCQAFRHLHNLTPSICIEDRSLTDIMLDGLSPLVPFVAKWCDEDVIREQVERVLMNL